jgi:hypothetical protein
MFGSDSLVAHLNAAPYDSTLATAGDVLAWLEVADANNGTVLWRGDTLSARATADSGRDENVSIPVGTIASGGTPIYIRMALRTTANLGHTLSGGYYFLEDSVGAGPPAKRSFPMQPAMPATGVAPETLRISVIPNPAGSSAELHLLVRQTGDVRVTIHDMLGEAIREIPRLTANDSGEYTLQLDIAGLPAGSYLIVARGSIGQTTSQFTVEH